MKVGIAQIDCELGNVAANVRAITSAAERAASDGCDLVVFPEMADTGYTMDAIRRHASAWDTGPCQDLRALAKRLKINMVCGLSERHDDRIHNSAACIDRAGNLLATYRKIHLFSLIKEDRLLSKGDAQVLVDIGGFKVGVMICYDVRFPELPRSLALGGADALVVIAAWPTIRIDDWRLLTRARAVENQLYVIAANRAGIDGPTEFGGNSCILDPSGKEIATAGQEVGTILLADLSHERVDEVRSKMAIFSDRRADVYG